MSKRVRAKVRLYSAKSCGVSPASPARRNAFPQSDTTFLSLQKLAEDEAVGGEGVHPVHICQWERFIAKLLLVFILS